MIFQITSITLAIAANVIKYKNFHMLLLQHEITLDSFQHKTTNCYIENLNL